nr:MAG TPA_asm: hypothetical protein [Caudoviricetes sp.]
MCSQNCSQMKMELILMYSILYRTMGCMFSAI